ncbi:8-oxo-dGTP pyrophosphatase MutT (NUDIX family) [Arcanobacterium hippocoleae]|uniref:8-oxo-dGTP pyrophosphatase MutT (NUDIX family) n=1 Tax=Arcanobacterium hippocoleae TaxID=149017 RepID=A0ABU1T3Z6_9ACTO|nr:8-oxo-dGTP pyrophosphatase MutT (NUDIX family) [Arcanobacterium hippocoleae]
MQERPKPFRGRSGGPHYVKRAASARTYYRRSNLPISNETSAGGVVVQVQDGQAYVAVIARRNRGGRLEWCLPKGHLEGQETAEQAAVREVREETGIHGRVLRHLASIDYWFSGDTTRIHKVVHHFLLEALSGELTVENDPDHEAENVSWVRIDLVSRQLAYANERRIVNIAHEILQPGVTQPSPHTPLQTPQKRRIYPGYRQRRNDPNPDYNSGR